MAELKKIERKGIITLDPEQFAPEAKDIATFDLSDYLFKGLVLKESEFRTALQNIDLEPFRDKFVHLVCSTNAIVPTWAYMLVAAKLHSTSKFISHNSNKVFLEEVILFRIINESEQKYNDNRVVIKGCGNLNLSEDLYIKITRYLLNDAKAIMFGEACSTVPVYKKGG